MVEIWFGGWEPIVRILIVGTLGYIALVGLLRLSGKRTLAQMNSFDFVITVAIGASFGRALTASSVALAEALTAFALLIVLQLAVTFLQLRTKGFSTVVTATPRLLAHDGQLVTDALRKERVTDDEVIAAVRKHGYGSLAETAAVIMESDGQLTVLAKDRMGDGSALAQVGGHLPGSEGQ